MKKLLALLLVTLLAMSVGSTFISALAADTEPFEWTLYFNYEWWGIRPWGEDDISAYWSEKFNMKINFMKPDTQPEDQVLQMMILSDDLPDVILMERGATNQELCRQGVFLDLAPLMEVNSTYGDEIAESTREFLKIDGTLYAIPHWARKGPTGGNDMWLYNDNLWKAAGSPALNTFEDLYGFAVALKELVPENAAGLPVIPFATQNNNDAFDKIVADGFYRSFGGPNRGDFYTARIGGRIQSVLRDPVFKDAAMEANKWYREGLILESQFIDTNDQMIEKFSSGRVGLLYYDHSQDSVNRFRKIMMENEPGNDYIRVLDPVYPMKEGVARTYADQKPTVGWNIHGITKNAKDPQRIFDFLCYMLTKEGSIDMMYGPPGVLYDELDENGNPILKKAMSELTAEENDKIGTWVWSFCNHSDNVDETKFAVNKMQPEELQDWVEATQSDILTPIMFVTDEYNNLALTIDQLSDLGIARTRCLDQWRAELPKIIMAQSAEEASKLYDDLLAFFEDNGLAEIEAAYDVMYQENVAMQGFSSYEGYGD
ncbi:MAG: hypothetical protein FWG37_01705 [Clostridia bacterium]|nr:hypothetical protein [Clostridia bacterium]